MNAITLEVLGSPAPKGSGRAILRGGHARHVASGSDTNARRLKSWDVAVREAAHASIGDVVVPPFCGVPLHVTITFRMARPSGHWGTGKHAGSLKPSAPAHPTTKPDIDKLTRATFDVLTGIVWDDDSRIVSVVVSKTYARPGTEGATVTVDVLHDAAESDSNVPPGRVAACHEM